MKINKKGHQMSFSRGAWDQNYRDAIVAKWEVIHSLQDDLEELEAKESKKAKSIFDYFKPSFYAKSPEVLEIEKKIEDLERSIKHNELEMYD